MACFDVHSMYLYKIYDVLIVFSTSANSTLSSVTPLIITVTCVLLLFYQNKIFDTNHVNVI